MSIKRILTKPIPVSEKESQKVLYTTELMHSKLSFLCVLTGSTKVQALNNIILEFINNHDKEIKKLIINKKNELDNFF